MPTVSVIIPCFNGAEFIERTLDGVRRQTFADVEVLLVDDGSTDDTVSIVRRCAPQVAILRHPGGANRGATASMNLGIDGSRAPYLAFLDADDLWRPTKLEEQVRAMEAAPEVGLSYTDGEVIDPSDAVLHDLMPRGHSEPNDPAALLLDCYIRTPSQVMVRRSVLDRVGRFNESYRYSKDHDLWVRLCERARLHFIDRKLVGYRQHPGQQSLRRDQWDEGFGVLDDAVRRFGYASDLCRRRKAVLHYRIGQHELRQGRRLHALARFSRALLHDPARAVSHSLGRLAPSLPGIRP